MADETKKAEQTAPPEAPKEPTLDDLKKKLAELEESNKKLKASVDAACSDASKRKKEAEDFKEKYKATLDEQKRRELETEEAHRQMAEQLAAYKAKERIASYTAKLMSAGYDETTASGMANELPDGVGDSFFEKQKAFLAAKTQEIKTQTLNSQPGLSVGMPPATSDKPKDPETENLRRWAGLTK